MNCIFDNSSQGDHLTRKSGNVRKWKRGRGEAGNLPEQIGE